jgi:hypothetical protein
MNLFSTSLCTILQSIAISGGTVHPMDGTRPYVGTVVVTDGVISGCGEEVQIPDGSQLIDAAGLHVVPGLIDGMMHHDGDHDDLYTQAGVVLARDMGNDLGRILFSKARSLRAGSAGPRLYISGAVLDGAPPITTKAALVRSADEARQKVERLLDLDVDFIATHSRVSEEALKGAAAMAHSSGKTIWGPVPRDLTLDSATAAGFDGVLGLDGFLSDPFGWVGTTEPDFSAGIKTVLAAGVMVMPVVNSVAARVRVPETPEQTLSLFSPHYGAQWRAELASRAGANVDDYYRRGALALARQERLVVELFGAGVHLIPGSGAPNPWVLPGDGLHDELDAWVRAGVPTVDVLRFATSGAASALGISESLGQLRPGLYGEMLVVDSDPREDISVLRRPRWVIQRGEALDRKTLKERVELLRERQVATTLAASLPLDVLPPETPAGVTILSGLIESEAYGERISSERYAVIELPADAGTAYCSRMIIPASATESASEVNFQQVILKRKVTSFSLKIQSQGTSLEVNGQQIGGQLRVERRVDGIFFDNNSSSDSVAVVDSGSAVALMAIAHNRDAGDFKALYFEDLDPIVADWTYAVKETGIHALTTGEGPMVALFQESGALDKMERTRGNGVIRHMGLETDLHGGAGVSLASTPPVDEEAPETEDPTPQDESERR